MTIRFPKGFERNPPSGFDGLFDWDWLKEPVQQATGRRIEPMDIDAHIEIKGQHLVIETKDAGKAVPYGQRQALLSFWARGYTMVMFLIGKADPVEVEIYYPYGAKRHISGQMTKEQIIEEVRAWAKWADKNPCPFQYNGR